MTLQEFYAGINENCDEVLKRFGGSSAMLEKFLKKFLDDATYMQLAEAMSSGDRDAIFRAAHTMKGLAGNFDFKELQSLAAKIVEEYRANNDSAIPALFEKLKASYEGVTSALKAYFGL